MQYRTLGRTGAKVSEIGFGAWAIGGVSEAAGMHWGWGEVPEKDAIAAVRKALECGVNFFDTADVYGHGRSEQILGSALASEWKKGILVASKVGNVVRNGRGTKDWSRQHIMRSCEQSLKRLKKDVIDLYQLHNPDLQAIRNGDWPDTLEELRRAGKIRWFGVSIFLPEEALAVIDRDKGDVLQVGYNALRQEMEAEVLPSALKRNIGIIARVPLYYGMLTGKYTTQTRFPENDHRSHSLPPELMQRLVPTVERIKTAIKNGNLAEWALKFGLSHPAVSTVIPGARNPQQAEANCRVSNGASLPQEQVAAVRRLWDKDEFLRQLRAPL